MAGITFTHSNPTVGTLSLRLPPTNVSWGYGINTSVTPTYGGQVVQLLSIRFDQLVVNGQFGKEGPSGLIKLTQYFRNYFAVASAGDAGDPTTRGNYNQKPMTLSYSGILNVDVDLNQGEQEWLVYPTSMPSYRRANDNFAPEWQLTCEIYQAPSDIYRNVEQEVTNRLANLRENVGYTPSNIFSDPDGVRVPFQPDTTQITQAEIDEAKSRALQNQTDFANQFLNSLPAYTEDDLIALLMGGASHPITRNTGS